MSQLNLVDLAGSEKANQTGAEGVSLKEGGSINKSLLMLGQAIQKLSSGDQKHINYRDSKLTRILQNSLGGNAKTAVIATVTPAQMSEEQTLSTLRFASQAKTIKTHAQAKINKLQVEGGKVCLHLKTSKSFSL
jgi:centromeric protein E